MACRLCTWLRTWLASPSMLDCDAYWSTLWRDSAQWEVADSNQRELWDMESPETLERLETASAIADSDPQAAIATYRELAEAGSVPAMELLAWHHDTGTVVPADFEQAQLYYCRAIDGGAWMATIAYARLLEAHGLDYEPMLQQGVEADFVPSYFWLAWLRLKRSGSRQTRREIRPLLEYAASKGHPGAQTTLARLMLTGKYGLRAIPEGFAMIRNGFPGTTAEPETDAATSPPPEGLTTAR